MQDKLNEPTAWRGVVLASLTELGLVTKITFKSGGKLLPQYILIVLAQSFCFVFVDGDSNLIFQTCTFVLFLCVFRFLPIDTVRCDQSVSDLTFRDWLPLRKNYSSCQRESWSERNQRTVLLRGFFFPADENFRMRKVGLMTFWDVDIYWRLLGKPTGFPSKEKLFLKTEKKTNQKEEKTDRVLSVALFLGFLSFSLLLFFFIFTKAMPKEGSTKASRLSLHRYQNRNVRGRRFVDTFTSTMNKNKKWWEGV